MRIPTTLAVGLWVASGLAVLSYTYIAFKQTANGLEAAGTVAVAEAAGGPLVASAAILAAEEIKPLERGKFRQSGN